MAGYTGTLGIDYYSADLTLTNLQNAIDSAASDRAYFEEIKRHAKRAASKIDSAINTLDQVVIRMTDFHKAVGDYVEAVKQQDSDFAAALASIENNMTNYTSTHTLDGLMAHISIDAFLQNAFPFIDGIYFGGNQSWFADIVDQEGGCGISAATNLLAYYALKDPAIADALGLDTTLLLTKAGYTDFMERVAKVFQPYALPDFLVALGAPSTFGVWPVDRWADMMKTFGAQHGLDITVHSLATSNLGFDDLGRTLDRTLYNIAVDFPSPINYNDGINFIREGLEKDCPVALLNTFNTVGMTNQDPSGHDSQTKMHWVTITDVQYNSDAMDYNLTVSSWGNTYTISYKELYKSWKGVTAANSGLAYIEVD